MVKLTNKTKCDFKRSGLDTTDIVTSKRKPALKEWAKEHLK